MPRQIDIKQNDRKSLRCFYGKLRLSIALARSIAGVNAFNRETIP